MTDNPFSAPEKEEVDIIEQMRSGRLATRGKRLLGALLDFVFTGLPTIGLAYVFGVYDRLDADGNPDLEGFVVGMIIEIVIFLSFNGYLMFKNGQTIGKYFVNTQVVMVDGSPISGSRYIWARQMPIWIWSSIPVVNLTVPIIDALLIFRSGRNTLHDDLAGTKVVNV